MGSGDGDRDEEDPESGIPSVDDLASALDDERSHHTKGARLGTDSSKFGDLLDRIGDRDSTRDSRLPPARGEKPSSTEAPAGGTSSTEPPIDGTSADWTAQDAKTEALLDLVGDNSNILVISELLTPEEYDICTRLLGAEQPTNLLLVTLSQSPDERLNVCRSYLGDLPGATTIVNVGEPTRGGDESPSHFDPDGPINVETIADPTDLMRLGIVLSRALTDLAARDGPTAMCFHSLTALLQFVDDQRTVFKFLHTLRGRVQSAGARAHYHLDGKAHDPEVTGLFRPVFDVTLRVHNDEVSIDR